LLYHWATPAPGGSDRRSVIRSPGCS